LIEDHAVFSRVFSSLLQREVPDAAISTAGDADSATSLATKLQPEYVLMDLHVPGANGLTLLQEVHRVAPNAMIAVVSADNDPKLPRQIYDAGGQGYISKGMDSDSLLQACVKFIQQGFFFSPSDIDLLRL
jgi:DNA-binding NarL/FixJ family response regulator